MGRCTMKVKGISRVLTSMFTSSPDQVKFYSFSGAQFLHLLNGIDITYLLSCCEDVLT